MFISPNGYGGVRKRIGHFRGGRFDLCCSHCGEWQWRGDKKGEGENNESVLLVCIRASVNQEESYNCSWWSRVTSTRRAGTDKPSPLIVNLEVNLCPIY